MKYLDNDSLDELEQLAREATPGPWAIYTADESDETMAMFEDFRVIAPDIGDEGEIDFFSDDIIIDASGVNKEENLNFIAVAHPLTILTLIAEIRELREAIQEAQP